MPFSGIAAFGLPSRGPCAAIEKKIKIGLAKINQPPSEKGTPGEADTKIKSHRTTQDTDAIGARRHHQRGMAKVA